MNIKFYTAKVINTIDKWLFRMVMKERRITSWAGRVMVDHALQKREQEFRDAHKIEPGPDWDIDSFMIDNILREAERQKPDDGELTLDLIEDAITEMHYDAMFTAGRASLNRESLERAASNILSDARHATIKTEYFIPKD